MDRVIPISSSHPNPHPHNNTHTQAASLHGLCVRLGWVEVLTKTNKNCTSPSHTRIALSQDQPRSHFIKTNSNCPLPRPLVTLKGSRISRRSTVPEDDPWCRHPAGRQEEPWAAAGVPSGWSIECASTWTPSPLSLLSWKKSLPCKCVTDKDTASVVCDPELLGNPLIAEQPDPLKLSLCWWIVH